MPDDVASTPSTPRDPALPFPNGFRQPGDVPASEGGHPGPHAGSVLKAIGKAWLALFGWKLEGHVPHAPRAVFVAAPHTTGWDLPFTLAVGWAMDMRISWVAKESLFRFPFGGVMRWMGGVPVVRDKRLSQVQTLAQIVREAPEGRFLIIAPSGTRQKRDHWKSGFVHISREADVPILLAFLDYEKKRGGLGPCFRLSGDLRADMDRIRAFYADVKGKYPEQTSTPRLHEEDAPAG